MAALVIDASAALAAILGEPGGDAVFDQLGEAVISAVNVAEVYTYAALNGFPVVAIDAFFADTGVLIVPFFHDQAVATGALAALTRKAGLSLADRACLALAAQEGAEVLTADRIWTSFGEELGLAISLIR